MKCVAFLVLLGICASCFGDAFTMRELEQTPIQPVAIEKKPDGSLFIDFGKDAFGHLELAIDAKADGQIVVRLGEKAIGKSVDLEPGGSIRHAEVKLVVHAGRHNYSVDTPADKRNTSGAAARLPPDVGVAMPFRYVEILSPPAGVELASCRQMMLHYPFDDSAASFHCDDDALNAVWELCNYSMKATSFAGIFIDGDRERIPYEADAYINQLGWYCTDGSVALPRHSHEYLLTHPTWPTEWKQFSIMLAYQDWMYSGDAESLRRNFNLLKNEKMLTKYARHDGLIDSSQLKDVIDWPPGERDGFVMSPVNTVVNAFHYHTWTLMSQMREAIGKTSDGHEKDQERREHFKDVFNQTFLDPQSGIYVDGEKIKHSSLHANLFPLAFGLVPDANKPKVIAFIKSRGMACSVYPAQFLLEGLFENGEADYPISLMTSDSQRSWRHMIDFGSTITTEAWDIKFKSNMDWNHAWGAAPANIIPRYVLGVRPTSPGLATAIIAPQIGKLNHVRGVVPTIHGPIAVRIDNGLLKVQVPAGVRAQINWPGKWEELKATPAP